jgi:hypothetical protein
MMQPEPSNIHHLPAPAKFVPPTLEMCSLQGAKTGLPQVEVEAFFHYNEARGWLLNGKPMKSWVSALAYWKSRAIGVRERGDQPSASMKMMRDLEDLKRTEAKIQDIRKRNGASGWPAEDLKLITDLKRRRETLKGILGFLA